MRLNAYLHGPLWGGERVYRVGKREKWKDFFKKYLHGLGCRVK